MTKTELSQLTRDLAKIEKTKIKLAALRDTLRNQISDLEDILESCNDAVEDLEDGKDHFQHAVETISQFV